MKMVGIDPGSPDGDMTTVVEMEANKDGSVTVTSVTRLQDAEKRIHDADLIPCKSCGAKAHLTYRCGAGYALQCTMRFHGCPMNARTHRSWDIEEVIARWNQCAPGVNPMPLASPALNESHPGSGQLS